MVNDEKKWSFFVADAIEKNLLELQSGLRDSTFVAYLQDHDLRLCDATNIKDKSLNSAWNFADQFFFAYAHSDQKMAGIEWSRAFKLIQDIVTKLKKGDPITEPVVLTFQHPLDKTSR